MFFRNFPLLHWNPTIPNLSFIVSRWFWGIFYVYLKFDWKSVTLNMWVVYIGSIPAPQQIMVSIAIQSITAVCLVAPFVHRRFSCTDRHIISPIRLCNGLPTFRGAMRGNQSCRPDPHVFQLRVKAISGPNFWHCLQYWVAIKQEQPRFQEDCVTPTCATWLSPPVPEGFRNFPGTCPGTFRNFPGISGTSPEFPELPRNFRNSGFCLNFKAKPIPESSFGTCP